MHEMSLTQSLLRIINEELERHGKRRLLGVTVAHGAMANVVPDAMAFAWEALTKGTAHEGATLTLREIPLEVECSRCGCVFQPAEKLVLKPCPECGEDLGHTVRAGKELYLESMDAE